MHEDPLSNEFATIDEDAEYVCGACGERIVIPVDLSGGLRQQYVEDCPVCCRPNRLTVDWDAVGRITIRSESA